MRRFMQVVLGTLGWWSLDMMTADADAARAACFKCFFDIYTGDIGCTNGSFASCSVSCGGSACECTNGGACNAGLAADGRVMGGTLVVLSGATMTLACGDRIVRRKYDKSQALVLEEKLSVILV